jgi:hypothetical protein
VFRKKTDELTKKDPRRGPLYLLVITLYDDTAEEDYYDEPVVNLARLDFGAEGLKKFKGDILSPAWSWLFFNFIYNNDFDLEKEKSYGDYISKSISDSNGEYGLRRVIGCDLPLMNITKENADEIIFGTFLELSQKPDATEASVDEI